MPEEVFSYPTEDELRRRLAAEEDNYVERKTAGDLKDIVNTFVAFANSVPIGQCGVLFVGVKDKGEIVGVQDPDQIQKSLTEKIDRAYPRIERDMRSMNEGGRKIVSVAIPGSERRPHFAGGAYIRDGSQVKEASQAQYEYLIAETSQKVRRLRQLRGKTVMVHTIRRERAEMLGRIASQRAMTIVDCDTFALAVSNNGDPLTYALDRVEILNDLHSGYRDNVTLEIQP